MLRRLAHGVGANLFDRFAISLVQIVSVPALVGTWGTSHYGLWLMLTTVPTYLALSDLGFAMAAGVQMTMHVARGEHERAVAVQHSARLALTTVGLILIALIWLVIGTGLMPNDMFGKAGGESIPITVGILSTYGVLILQGGIAAVTLRSDGLYALGSFITTAINVVEQLAVVVCVLMGGGVLQAALCLLLCRMLGVVVLGLTVQFKIRWLPFGVRHANLRDIKSLYGPAQATMAMTLANASFLQGITLAVGLAATAASVPVFNITRTMVRLGIQMTNVLSAAIAPEFSAMFAREDKRAQALVIVSVLVFSAAILIPAAIVMMIFGHQIIAIWSLGKIHASQAMIAVMAIVMVLNGLWTPLSTIIISTNRHSSFTYHFLLLSLVSVALAYYLSLHLGSLGGALANLALDLAMSVVVFRASKRLLAGRSELLEAFAALPGRARELISTRLRKKSAL